MSGALIAATAEGLVRGDAQLWQAIVAWAEERGGGKLSDVEMALNRIVRRIVEMAPIIAKEPKYKSAQAGDVWPSIQDADFLSGLAQGSLSSADLRYEERLDAVLAAHGRICDALRASIQASIRDERDDLRNVFGRISCAVHAIDGKGDNTIADDVIARIQAIGADAQRAATAEREVERLKRWAVDNPSAVPQLVYDLAAERDAAVARADRNAKAIEIVAAARDSAELRAEKAECARDHEHARAEANMRERDALRDCANYIAVVSARTKATAWWESWKKSEARVGRLEAALDECARLAAQPVSKSIDVLRDICRVARDLVPIAATRVPAPEHESPPRPCPACGVDMGLAAPVGLCGPCSIAGPPPSASRQAQR